MATMVLLDRLVQVDYAQLYVLSDPEAESIDGDPFVGQVNGMCGAAVTGTLWLNIGVQTGQVRMRIELKSAEEPVSDSWEDVVEVAFQALTDVAALKEWAGERYQLGLPAGTYRARYCARGLDLAEDAGRTMQGDPRGRYLLELWPAPAAPDKVIRATTSTATTWHRQWASASANSADQDSEKAEIQKSLFGDREPNERLRAVGESASGAVGVLSQIDKDLLFALADISNARHREIAAWAAEQSLIIAGMADLPVLAAAMTALRAGRKAPRPFSDTGRIGELLSHAASRTTVEVIPGTGQDHKKEILQQLYAAEALVATTESDSLTAAVRTLVMAARAHGLEYVDLFGRLRRKFRL